MTGEVRRKLINLMRWFLLLFESALFGDVSSAFLGSPDELNQIAWDPETGRKGKTQTSLNLSDMIALSYNGDSKELLCLSFEKLSIRSKQSGYKEEVWINLPKVYLKISSSCINNLVALLGHHCLDVTAVFTSWRPIGLRCYESDGASIDWSITVWIACLVIEVRILDQRFPNRMGFTALRRFTQTLRSNTETRSLSSFACSRRVCDTPSSPESCHLGDQTSWPVGWRDRDRNSARGGRGDREQWQTNHHVQW